VKLNPANGDCWNTLAHVLFKKGDYGGASKAIEMAIQSVSVQICRKAKTKYH
jgi:cytochrome c-type biogenesis protein CcmH/NrfG